MKKIAILTINDDNNYGNRLQNYALQFAIERLNMQVKTIKNNNKNVKEKNESAINKIKRCIKSFLVKIKRNLKGENKFILKRKINFQKFNEKNIKLTDYIINKDNIPEKLANEFDYFVIGSDQVWNPTFNRISDIDFASFAPKNKVISYAASFGVNSIDGSLINFYKKGLNNINYISVREEKGKEIVKNIINREAVVVLDPTLLLSKDEWEKVTERPESIPSKKYILTYFLGDISEERKNELKKLTEKYNLDIVNLGKLNDKKYYMAGPSEFLWYIQNANIIFTDSFHACVFSIIFDKTFYIMNREDDMRAMNSRIDTLLTKFKLKSQEFNSWESISIQHDYSHVNEILKEEKGKSLNYLKKALDILN